MRALITGQIGLDKKHFIETVAKIAKSNGEDLKIYNIGDMMYQETPTVRPGRILDLPLATLNSLRRAVMRDVLADMHNHKNVIVNTHATFRWKHGLFSAFDFDQMAAFDADLYVTLVDNIETVHQRMLRDHDFEHSLKDLMVWREEEILATEILARSIRRSANNSSLATDNRPLATEARFFVLSRGRFNMTTETLYRLIFRPNLKTCYPSFPMSHVMDLPDTLREIDDFRARIAQKMIAFDPGDVDEKVLSDLAIRAAQQGKQTLTIYPGDPIKTAQTNFGDLLNAPAVTPPMTHDSAPSTQHSALQLKVADLLQIVPDIDGQIYARDFMLVRQSDMTVSYIPELPGTDGKPGKPGLSSGVERELQHAHEHAKEVYVIWKPKKEPSPFITQTADKVFRSVDEAFAYFDQKGYFQPHSLFGS